jgi:hypothetical protein
VKLLQELIGVVGEAIVFNIDGESFVALRLNG